MTESQKDKKIQDYFQKLILANQQINDGEYEILRLKKEIEAITEQNIFLQAQSKKYLNIEDDKFNFSDLSLDSPIILEINNMSESQVKKMASSLYREYKKILGERNGFIEDRTQVATEIDKLKLRLSEKDKFLENMNEKVEILIQENSDLKMDIFKLNCQIAKEKTSDSDEINMEESYINVSN